MPKLLAEFLREQQEPFVLEVYLVERGYSAAQILKRSATCGLRKKGRYPINPSCSKFVKAVFGRLLLHNDQKIKNPPNYGGQKNAASDNRESTEEHANGDEFSSASVKTVSISCSESDAHCSQEEEEDNTSLISEEAADADRNLKWRSMDDTNKQLSPVSVLEETESDEVVSSLHHKEYNFQTTQGESSTSISHCKSRQPTNYSVQELVGSNSYTQYIINKKALQQTKQLLIDCLREVIENHRKRDKGRQQLKNILGADKLWKLVCENVWLWSQDSIDETNIVHLLHYDFLASAEEWSADSEQQKEEIAVEIGDAILEGIINEIITY